MNQTKINKFIMLIIIKNAYKLNFNVILELKTTSNGAVEYADCFSAEV